MDEPREEQDMVTSEQTPTPPSRAEGRGQLFLVGVAAIVVAVVVVALKSYYG